MVLAVGIMRKLFYCFAFAGARCAVLCCAVLCCAVLIMRKLFYCFVFAGACCCAALCCDVLASGREAAAAPRATDK